MIPERAEVRSLLALRQESGLEELLDSSLLDPLRGFLAWPGKQIRGKLVELGWRLGQPDESAPYDFAASQRCAKLAAALEALHAGSLIIDDIEDQSVERRGRPALHVQHGTALALNAGNWLYFWPFEVVRAIGLSEAQELKLYRRFHETLLRAHFGQALDLGTRIDSLPREQVRAPCLAALELKTGALVALALVSGAVLAGAEEPVLSALEEYGVKLGAGLQMFDDLGPKRLEDLTRKCPSWLWACAAALESGDYVDFVACVARLPGEARALDEWLARTGLLSAAREDASAYLKDALRVLRAQWHLTPSREEACAALGRIQKQIEEAYGI